MKEEDEDPQMARAAVYYQLVLEDKLVSKVSTYRELISDPLENANNEEASKDSR